jgi:glutathione S-transferase
MPTLVHDEKPILEPSLILYYVDDVFPEPQLMQKAPLQRFMACIYNKLIDGHPSQFPEGTARILAGRGQQGAAQAAGGLQAERD